MLPSPTPAASKQGREEFTATTDADGAARLAAINSSGTLTRLPEAPVVETLRVEPDPLQAPPAERSMTAGLPSGGCRASFHRST